MSDEVLLQLIKTSQFICLSLIIGMTLLGSIITFSIIKHYVNYFEHKETMEDKAYEEYEDEISRAEWDNFKNSVEEFKKSIEEVKDSLVIVRYDARQIINYIADNNWYNEVLGDPKM